MQKLSAWTMSSLEVLHPPSTVKQLVVVQDQHLHLLILKHQHLHLLRRSTHQLVKIKRKKILQTQRTEMQDCSIMQLTFINYSNPYVSFLDNVLINKNHK